VIELDELEDEEALACCVGDVSQSAGAHIGQRMRKEISPPEPLSGGTDGKMNKLLHRSHTARVGLEDSSSSITELPDD